MALLGERIVLTMGMSGRKWNIFLHSVELFSTRGYNNISMRDIAAAEGIKVASIYNHFESKEDILDTIFNYDKEAQNTLTPYLERLPMEATDPGLHPIGSIYRMQVYPDPETRAFRNKITAIAVTEIYSNPQADELLQRNFVRSPKYYIIKILESLHACGRIEAMDMVSFADLYAHHALSSAILATTRESISTQQWIAGVNMLTTLIPLILPVTGAMPKDIFQYLRQCSEI